MKNSVFTIVAKNYLPLAKSLMDSVRQHNKDCLLFVIVADELNADQKFNIEDCVILESKNLNIPDFTEMAFKYNITEFCTAIKPYCFEYLKLNYSCSKIIFFDPDVYLFDDVNVINNDLGDKLCLLSPHYFTPEINYTGAVPEEMILWVGIFNLGFIALNTDNSKARKMLDWWKNRLTSSCYADKQDGLHTDQKWIDYLPSYFPNDTKVSQNMGYNLSVWNLHERQIINNNETFEVKNLIDPTIENNKLVFIHFSGFDIKNINTIHKHHPILNTTNRPDMIDVLEMYRTSLLNNEYYTTITWPYTYNVFDNGLPIILFQRRIFRRLLALGEKIDNPFSTGVDSFYSTLKRNHILVTQNTVDKQTAANVSAHSGKIKLVFKMMKLLSIVLGINKYALLLKFLSRYSRPENQIFLIDTWRGKYQFYNENIRVK